MPICPRRVKVGCRAGGVRRGFTLAELLMSVALMTLIAGAMGSLAYTMRTASDFSHAQSLGAQHARVVLGRITQNVNSAYANESFPGCMVISTALGAYTYPDVLVVWNPTGAPANPAGLPLVSELIVYAAHQTNPNRLLELTWGSNSAQAPAATDTSGWTTLINSFLQNSAVTSVELTNLLRKGATGAVTPFGQTNTSTRGAIRFVRLMAPTDQEWTAYRANTLAWNNINWPLDVYGSKFGIRYVNLQIEMQIAPNSGASTANTADQIIPFFDSATCTYSLSQ